MRNIVLIATVFLFSSTAFTQTISIKGTVTDDAHDPLPGVSIIEKGTTNGTTSDFDGKFSLNISGKNAVLLISHIGFTTREIVVGNQTFPLTQSLPPL